MPIGPKLGDEIENRQLEFGNVIVPLAERRSWRYVAAVISLKCSVCASELAPGANFCRRCGAVVTDSSNVEVNSSELPTEMLDQRNDLTTSRLNPRATSPETPLRTVVPDLPSGDFDPAAQASRRRWILIGSVFVVLLLCGIIASVAYVRMGTNNRTSDDAMLFYPGSQTIVDVSSGDGRAIQLQSGDSLEKVIDWYEKSIKPTKTMRLTSTSVVLKNENVTTTLASEGGKTNILIKRIR